MTEKEKKEAAMTPEERMQRSIIKKFKKEIWRKYTAAINDYALIEEGDKIAIPLWGDVKSLLLFEETQEILKHGVNNFTYKTIIVPTFLSDSREGFDYVRGQAEALGCNKIATTETFDDVIQTILIRVLYEGRVETLMPREDNIIRPLYLTRDRDIEHFAVYNSRQERPDWNIILLKLAGEERKEMRRRKKEMQALLEELEAGNKYVPMNLFRSVENVNLATLTGYTKDEIYHNFLENYDIGKS